MGKRATILAGLLALLCGLRATALEDKDETSPAKKAGTVTGIVASKGDNFIEVKADGEEKPRRYVPHWRGGLPAQGGGLDKKMLQTFKTLRIGDRIRLEWEYEERARAVKVEVLKPAAKKERE